MSRSSFFRNVQNLFLGKKDNVHAVRRHHHFRNPEEGASRPGFLRGLGLETPAAVGAEILAETKKKGSQMMLILLVVGLIFYLKSRAGL